MASALITDEFAYRLSYDKADYLTVRFPFCDVEHYEELPMWGRRSFGHVLDDETLLKFGVTLHKPAKVELIGTDGQVKFSREMPKHDFINYAKIATDDRNHRFALMVNTDRGEHPSMDITGHLVARRVLVLNDAGEKVASILADSEYHMDSDFSMSPDGHRIAILDDGVVKVAELE